MSAVKRDGPIAAKAYCKRVRGTGNHRTMKSLIRPSVSLSRTVVSSPQHPFDRRTWDSNLWLVSLHYNYYYCSWHMVTRKSTQIRGHGDQMWPTVSFYNLLQFRFLSKRTVSSKNKWTRIDEITAVRCFIIGFALSLTLVTSVSRFDSNAKSIRLNHTRTTRMAPGQSTRLSFVIIKLVVCIFSD